MQTKKFSDIFIKYPEIIQKIFTIIILVLFFYLVIGECVFPDERDSLSAHSQEFEASWVRVLENGETIPVEVPGKLPAARNEVVSLSTTLPDTILINSMLCFEPIWQDADVYIDGELRYHYNTENSRPFGTSSTTRYLFVALEPEDAGKELNYQFASSVKYAGDMRRVLIGDRYGLWLQIIKGSGAKTFIAAFLLLLSFFCIVVCLIMRYVYKKTLSLHHLAWAIFLCSFWMLSESEINQLIVPNLSVLTSFTYWSLMLVPFPMLLYLDDIQNGRYRNVYLFPLLYSFVIFVVCTILQIFDIVQFTSSLIWVHIGLSMSIIVMLTTIVIDLFRKKLSGYLSVGIGFSGMLFTAILEVLLYYVEATLSMGTFLALGLLFLLGMAIIKSGQDLFQSEKNKQQALIARDAQAKFLANMSHEIRTPINVIIGMNEMILREAQDDTIQGYSYDIQNASNMLLGLINDILDFTKIESGQLELSQGEYNLSSLIQDLNLLFKARAGGKPISTKIDIDTTLPSKLYGDDLRIKQVLVNILSNAVKYTHQGSVTLKVYCRQIDNDYITLCFSVSDTGIGIKEEDIPKLFDSFKRLDINKNRAIQGSGLGLNIAKQLVELMNGTVTVKSKYGEGSTFKVYIPQKIIDATPIKNMEAALSQSRKAASNTGKFTAENAHVLVVDDNTVNLSLMKGLFKRTQMNVDLADSGRKALDLCMEKSYDIIFMDHMMPEMDGVETLHLLRKDMSNPNHDTIVVALTANAVAGCREQYLGYGFDDYFSKPIQADKLDDLLIRLLPKELINLVD